MKNLERLIELVRDAKPTISAKANLREQVKRSGRSQNTHSNVVGGSPTASYFILLVQNKVTKQKAPYAKAFGFPALLDWHGGCGTRPQKAPRAQTVLAEIPIPVCATRHGIRDQFNLVATHNG